MARAISAAWRRSREARAASEGRPSVCLPSPVGPIGPFAQAPGTRPDGHPTTWPSDRGAAIRPLAAAQYPTDAHAASAWPQAWFEAAVSAQVASR